MPYALMCGHAMNLMDPEITTVFNGISIGFDLPYIIEGEKTFDEVMDTYRGWMNINVRLGF